MKYIYIYVMIFVTFSMSSQNNLWDVLKIVAPANGKSNITLSKTHTQKYVLGEDNFKNLKKAKIIELIESPSNIPRFCLIQLGCKKQYKIYTIIAYDFKSQQSNTIVPEAFNYYILYDSKKNNLFYFESEKNGSLYKSNTNNIVLTYDLTKVVPIVYKLDSKLKPTAGLSCFGDNTNKSCNLFICEYTKNVLKLKSAKLDSEESNVLFMPFEKLIYNLNIKPNKYDEIRDCGNNYCFLQILLNFNPK